MFFLNIDRLSPAAKGGEIVLALARDWPRGRKYEGELEAIIVNCLGVASPSSGQGLMPVLLEAGSFLTRG